MSRTAPESKAIRDNLTGHNAGAVVPVPELITLAGGNVRNRFLALENAEQRHGFLDAIIAKLGSNLGDWATFYEAVEIVHEQKQYWHSKGFGSFEAFWHSIAGPSFRSFKDLEDVYNFAKTACPELFGIDFAGAKLLRERLAALQKIPALHAHGGGRIKKRLYAGRDEAHQAVAQAMTWHNAGGTSLEYRLAKIKRDRPDIAARVLAGEFFKQLGTGQIGIDMASAEREAFGTSTTRPRKPPPKASEQVAAIIRSAAKSSVSREDFIAELSKIPWLAQGIAAALKMRK
jgi:hypothetical protein